MKLIILTALTVVPMLALDKEPAKRLEESAAVFSEIMATPDKGIPQEMMENAHCIVIVPGMKTAAFVFGGKYGKGYMSCRNKGGAGWSAPGTVRIEGGSVGFQIGGSETDLIMLVMNERGVEKLLQSKLPWARKVRLPPDRLVGRPLRKQTPKCTPRFFPGRARRDCSPVWHCKAPPSGRTWMTTQLFTEEKWRIAPL